MNKYNIYSDGSLKGSYLTKETKPQRGGYSAIICDEDNNIIKEIYGGRLKSTSPRMELMGVIEGLKGIKKPSEITVISDSQYIVSTINDNGIERILKNPESFSNIDLGTELVKLLSFHKVTMEGTKGHSDNKLNNYADKLAQFAARCLNLPEDEYINNSKTSGKSLVSQSETGRSNGFDSRQENGNILYSFR